MAGGGSHAIRRLAEFLNESRDLFDRNVANPLSDVLDASGEKDFTPERLRLFKDGNRRYLQYGDDANYSELAAGHLLAPDADQTMTMKTGERAAYPVGNDLWASLSREINGTLQTGDAVGGGYGEIDIGNFDPATETWSGTAADGYFWMHTAATGLDQALLIGARGGSVFDKRTVDLYKTADVFEVIEQRLNWYDVGPSVFRETFTDIADFPDEPQRNKQIGAIANDDGKAAERGSQRVQVGIKQAAGNTGLEVEVGSIGVRTPGNADPEFKTKGHSMDLEVTNGTEGTYQVCAAMRIDQTNATVKLRFPSIEIIKTPGNSQTRTRVMFTAVGPEETDADTKTFSTPVEHSPANSVAREVEDNTITGPIQGAAGNDITGPDTANTMTNPGGYQLARDSVTPEQAGSAGAFSGTLAGNRELYDTDFALILVDAATTGTCEIDVQTEQNS